MREPGRRQASRARTGLKQAGEEWLLEAAKCRPRPGRESQDPVGGYQVPGKAATRWSAGVWGALLSKGRWSDLELPDLHLPSSVCR